MGLALNFPGRLICHKNKDTKLNLLLCCLYFSFIYYIVAFNKTILKIVYSLFNSYVVCLQSRVDCFDGMLWVIDDLVSSLFNLGFDIWRHCFFLYPILIRWHLLVREGWKWISEGRKKREEDTFLNFNFITRFNNYSIGVEILPETNGNGHVFQIRR